MESFSSSPLWGIVLVILFLGCRPPLCFPVLCGFVIFVFLVSCFFSSFLLRFLSQASGFSLGIALVVFSPGWGSACCLLLVGFVFFSSHLVCLPVLL